MDLWIRSQDKRILQKIDNIFTNANYDNKRICTICDNDVVELGEYNSKERTLEVLDEIQDFITINNSFDLYAKTGDFPKKFTEQYSYASTFQMPKE